MIILIYFLIQLHKIDANMHINTNATIITNTNTNNHININMNINTNSNTNTNPPAPLWRHQAVGLKGSSHQVLKSSSLQILNPQVINP